MLDGQVFYAKVRKKYIWKKKKVALETDILGVDLGIVT